MSNADKLDKIKKKIAALLAMTEVNGASEQEAINAMTMAAKLMSSYGLTEEDIRNSTSNDFVKEMMDATRKKLHEVDCYLTTTIADYCGVKCYVNRDKGAGMVFFGYGVDVELCKYIRKICHFALDYEWAMYFAAYEGSTHGRTLRKSFMVGMTNRLRQRLAALKEDKTVYSNSTALISLKNQMVEEEFFKQNNIKLRKGPKATAAKINDALYAGYAAGDKVNFNRKVEEGGTKILAIGSY